MARKRTSDVALSYVERDETETAVKHARATAQQAAEEAFKQALATIQEDRTPGRWWIEAHPTHRLDMLLYMVFSEEGFTNRAGSFIPYAVAGELDNLGDARLIAAAPDLLAYVQARAEAGDPEAQALATQVREAPVRMGDP